MYVISNMYPSINDPYFGVFVKNFCEGLEADDKISIVARSLICGRGKSFFQKVVKYVIFYLSIIFNTLHADYEIIYVHNVSHSLLPLYSAFIRRLFKKILIVVNPHGEDMIITHRIDGVMLKLSLPIVKTASQIVSPSNYYKNEIARMYNLDRNKIYVSPSGGVNLALFRPASFKLVEGNEKKLGFVSRIDGDKGWDTFLIAISKLVKDDKFNSLKVVFVGKGEKTTEFLKMINELQIQNHVEYLGFKSQTELPQVFNSLDAFVFPTKMYESLGLVGLEAMACGIPVIASDRGGINDYVIDGYNGYKFECDNNESLVQSINKFYRLNSSEIQEMKQNALETSYKYSNEIVSKNMVTNLLNLNETL